MRKNTLLIKRIRVFLSLILAATVLSALSLSDYNHISALAEEIPSVSYNLITNGDFENGTNGWTVNIWQNATKPMIVQDEITGSKVAYFSKTAKRHIIFQSFGVAQNTEYVFSYFDETGSEVSEFTDVSHREIIFQSVPVEKNINYLFSFSYKREK